jgi:hypothetical protein
MAPFPVLGRCVTEFVISSFREMVLQATCIYHDRPVFFCITLYASHYNGWLQISLWDQKECNRLHDNRKALLDSLLLLNIPPTVVKTVFFLTLAKLSDIRYNPWCHPICSFSELVPLVCGREVRQNPVNLSVDYFELSVCKLFHIIIQNAFLCAHIRYS